MTTGTGKRKIGPLHQELTNGATHSNPVPGPQTQTRARYRTAVPLVKANAVKVEYPLGANIKELVVFCTPATPEAAQTGDYGIIVIDPASDGIAQLMLTQTDSETGDAGWFPIPPNELVRIPLTAPLKEGSLGGGRVELLSVGVAMNFWVGGN